MRLAPPRELSVASAQLALESHLNDALANSILFRFGQMKRAMLLIPGWLVVTLGLYVALVALELYWNIFNWRLRLDWVAAGLNMAVFLPLIATWFLARATRDIITQIVSLALCLTLLGLGIYIWPREPLTQGLFARETASPIWYRTGRLF